VRLREPDGVLELLIAEALGRAGSFHDGVGPRAWRRWSMTSTASRWVRGAQDLCVADRQFLMHRATTVWVWRIIGSRSSCFPSAA